MSVSSEVQRTLVKSPPELWAELSDPATLARHLGELGEIRIVRTEPERTVDWEATGAEVSGRVEIKPSGWGTRVTLSASRQIAATGVKAGVRTIEVIPAPGIEAGVGIEVETIEVIPAPGIEAGVGIEVETIEVIPAPGIEAGVGIEVETIEVIPAPAPEPEPVEPAPRPGFLARLFRRRKELPEPKVEPEPTVEPEPPEAVVIEAPAPEEAVPVEEILPETDLAAELTELEQQTTAVLTGVLDRLGAAHHRPFSRA